MSALTDPRDARLTLDDLVRHLAAIEDETARRELLLAHLQDFDHETLFTRLKDESERYRTSAAQGSLRLAEGLIFAAERAGRPGHRAMGMMARGDATWALGRFAEGVALLDEAGAAFLALGDEVGWARTRLGWLFASYHLGHGEAALATMDRPRAILVRAAMWLRVGILDLNAGIVHWNLGHYAQSLARYEQAQQIFETLGESASLQAIWAKANVANVLLFLGDFERALRLHEEVKLAWLQRGDALSVAKTDINIAAVFTGQGYYTRALQRHVLVRDVLRTAESPLDEALGMLGMIQAYLRLNLFPQALALGEDASDRFERLGVPTAAARARFACAIAHAYLEDHEQAIALLDGAIASFAAAGMRQEEALGAMHRARLALAEQDWATALQAATRAGTSFAERKQVHYRVEADLVLAQALLGRGESGPGATVAREALLLARERELTWLYPEAHTILGNVARAQGDWHGARAEYDRAIASIEWHQRFLAVDLRFNFLADKRQVYDAALAVSLEMQRPAEAFTYHERAKSRALVDYLANTLEVQIGAASPTDHDLGARLTRLRAEHNWFYSQLYRADVTGEGAGGGVTNEALLQAAIRERERQIEEIVEQLALDRTEGLALATTLEVRDYGPPADLPEGAVLLEYAFHEGRGTVFVVADGKTTAVALTNAGAGLQRLLRGWQLHLATAARAVAYGEGIDGLVRSGQALLGALYQALLAPVEPALAGRKALIVVPYGPLHAVPFQALYDGSRYLIERCEVVTSPSAALLRLCRARADRARRADRPVDALVMANSGDGRLPHVLEEARAVAALFPGTLLTEQGATRERLASLGGHHAILHLAAHGEARLDNPTFAHLQLADGQLSTVDIFNMRLPGTLVVLSACETGRTAVAGVDELIGLSRGFLYAGATTLVQSLWRVADASTERLMVRFYRALRAGQPKGAALREAQCALLQGQERHPYFWAPFQLLGDSGPLSGREVA